ncbi:hypothetical protein MIND_01404600 [Mycena indigotica]|uniref:Alpha-type protein kinase domain-containing protein n=1 Tax=Mycena indigotica TaxID=2126181 RepID=A0A8H6VP40_9AGAR|nr:uncharacterized protein MIND_01404600 [Mycena indigotica]KAF7288887.1 hypothetical protein MIND_01404600 [Mycena indigotica]
MTDSPKTPCDDCGGEFPTRQGTGPCLKCSKLSKHARDSDQYKDISQWPQCEMCGITRRNMPSTGPTQTCNAPACNRNPLGPAAGGKENLPDIQRDRNAIFFARLQKNSPITGPNPGTALTTEELLNREHGGGMPGERQIHIGCQIRVAKGNTARINEGLGWVRKAAKDVKSQLLDNLNTKWTKTHSHKILDEEVELRFQGGQDLLGDTEALTVDQFYLKYSSPAHRGDYLDNISKPWDKNSYVKAKRPFLPMELLFHQEIHEARIKKSDNGDDLTSTHVHRRKRERTMSGTTSTTSFKKPRGYSHFPSMAPVSLFGLPSRKDVTVISKQSSISFIKVSAVTGGQNGVTKLINTGKSYQGTIADEAFNRGQMKQAHDASIKDSFVAKRFYQLDEHGLEVDIADNNVEIRLEATRQSQLNWFLESFYRFTGTHAQGQDVSVDQNITAAEVFIAKEVEQASRASGMLLSELKEDDEAIEWLVEERRAQAVKKISGTLSHKQLANDLVSSTVSAFAHFAFGFSNRQLVFADLQGTRAIVKDHVGLVLFDVMTHTLAGDSGVGDFGEKGIRSFVEQHQCSPVCTGFQLDQMYPLEPADSDKEDSDELTDSNNLVGYGSE